MKTFYLFQSSCNTSCITVFHTFEVNARITLTSSQFTLLQAVMNDFTMIQFFFFNRLSNNAFSVFNNDGRLWTVHYGPLEQCTHDSLVYALGLGIARDLTMC